MKLIQGGIVAPKGFQAIGQAIGLKKGKKDLAIIYSEEPCVYAGAFTQNVVKAAPVVWDQEVLAKGTLVKGVVVNSGNANAVTGEQGYLDTKTMAEVTAEGLKVTADEVLVCSTGVIGVPLPMDIITKGIQETVPHLSNSAEAGASAEEAILTTDTCKKTISVEAEIGGVTVSLGAMGKGSGMIHPNMATMLGFVTTDVAISQEMLQQALKNCVNTTFNMITVDGDTSTNDTVIVLANGKAGNKTITGPGEDYDTFCKMLYEALKYIAVSIVKDGEGATKLLEVNIKGVKSFASGKILAKSILTSSLVKTAFFGEDANWGRILAAMGYSGEQFDVSKVDLTLESNGGTITLFKAGKRLLFNENKAKEILQEAEIMIQVTMGEGEESVTAWGCDLSYEYVKINGEYRS